MSVILHLIRSKVNLPTDQCVFEDWEHPCSCSACETILPDFLAILKRALQTCGGGAQEQVKLGTYLINNNFNSI